MYWRNVLRLAVRSDRLPNIRDGAALCTADAGMGRPETAQSLDVVVVEVAALFPVNALLLDYSVSFQGYSDLTYCQERGAALTTSKVREALAIAESLRKCFEGT